MAKEAESLLETTEKFVQLYVFRITSHSFHSAAGGYSTGHGSERSSGAGLKRSASDADLRDGNGEDIDRKRGVEADRGPNGNGDPLNFQWIYVCTELM